MIIISLQSTEFPKILARSILITADQTRILGHPVPYLKYVETAKELMAGCCVEADLAVERFDDAVEEPPGELAVCRSAGQRPLSAMNDPNFAFKYDMTDNASNWLTSH